MGGVTHVCFVFSDLVTPGELLAVGRAAGFDSRVAGEFRGLYAGPCRSEQRVAAEFGQWLWLAVSSVPQLASAAFAFDDCGDGPAHPAGHALLQLVRAHTHGRVAVVVTRAHFTQVDAEVGALADPGLHIERAPALHPAIRGWEIRERVERAQSRAGAREGEGRHTEQLVMRWYDQLWNGRDEAALSEIVHPAVRLRGSLGSTHQGHSGVLAYIRTVRSAMPDFQNRVDELIVEGDRAFARLTYSGTHRGELLQRAPTGRRIEYAGAARFAQCDGLLTDVWVLGDLDSLRAQIA